MKLKVTLLIIADRGGVRMALDGMDRMAREEYTGAAPRVFVTNPDAPENGRTFIWTQMGWLEREEGSWGDVAFSPVADSEDQLRDWIDRETPDVDLVELDNKNEYGRTVLQEFKENAENALYPESPETSSEEPFEEQDVT
jgi:hypothetical protein